MDYTKNLNLSKPSYDDDVDVQVLNNNMDILDNTIKRNLDKFNQYLPLGGGTMQGNIKLPYNIWQGLRSVRNDEEYLSFNETSFKTVKLPTLCTKSSRFKFYYNDDDAFTIDNTGAWFNNDRLIADTSTTVGWHSGYTRLSTGMLLQWGYVNPANSLYNVQHQTFSMPFADEHYAVVTSRSFGVDDKSASFEGRWGSATFNMTATGFDIICAQSSTYGHAEFWIAIGKGV